jgi:uncharacterized protein
MSPQFDPDKNASNIAKHGISLTDGDGVVHDPLGIMDTLGTNSFGELRVVVWTDREGDNRTISVRKATPKERRDYESRI